MTTPNPTQLNLVPFLRNQRHYPEDIGPLRVEINKSYIDIANAVNARTAGLFSTDSPIPTGEAWFLSANKRQSGIRQTYEFSGSTTTINHNLNFTSIYKFVRIWGTFFDGTNWQTLPYVDVVNANNQINIKVNSTQIVITKGAGSPPTIQLGTITLEWITQP